MNHLRSFLGCCLLSLAVSAGLAAPAFPDPSQLPSRPDLPDPLRMLNGERITSAQDWTTKRRPELKALFEHYMYGQMPAPEGTFSVDRTDRGCLGGKATRKDVSIRVSSGKVIPLLLVIPNQRQGKLPAFVGMNFCGNHTVLNDPTIALPKSWLPNSCAGCTNNQATDVGRGSQVDTWAVEQTIDRGYAFATFYAGDVEPDRPDAREGVRSTRPDLDWGTIAAWAWGFSEAVSYLVSDPDIDARRIAVVGHSRNGKAALVAAAFDERIALAIPLQAGCGGTAPSRGRVGESVKQINDRFPHWFNAEFKQFNDHPDRLPFDQHCLIALCAPRPVLLPNAVEDQWANPKGQFEMLLAADPVYRLLGVEGIATREMPEVRKLVDSTLGYYIRPGKHSMTRDDWKVFLDFGDKHLRGR